MSTKIVHILQGDSSPPTDFFRLFLCLFVFLVGSSATPPSLPETCKRGRTSTRYINKVWGPARHQSYRKAANCCFRDSYVYAKNEQTITTECTMIASHNNTTAKSQCCSLTISVSNFRSLQNLYSRRGRTSTLYMRKGSTGRYVTHHCTCPLREWIFHCRSITRMLWLSNNLGRFFSDFSFGK